MNELEIYIRPYSISIQAQNIKDKTEQAKSVLRSALEAMENKPDESYKNEFVYKKPKP